eukprot:5986781-Amphidinium_carterae.1
MVDAIRANDWDPDSPRSVLLKASLVEKKDTGGAGSSRLRRSSREEPHETTCEEDTTAQEKQ